MDEGYDGRRFTAQDGLSLFYRDYGDPLAPATPILCLAGLTRNSRDFHALALQLKARRRVLAPDYRGRGRSDNDPEWRRYAGPVYLNDVLHLLALSDIGRVIVIGTSMGGLIGMGLGAVQPTSLAGLVMNDVGPDLGVDGIRRITAQGGDSLILPDWPAAVAHVKAAFRNHPEKSEADWLETARATFREDEDGRLRPDYDPALFRALAGGAGAPDLWTLYRALRPIPTLAIRGELSDVLSAATFDRMAAEKPDLVRVRVPGVGHVPAYSQPEIAEALHGFLDGIDQHTRQPTGLAHA